MNPSLLLRYSTSQSLRTPSLDGTDKRHSNAQVRVWYSTLGAINTIYDVLDSWNLCLFIYHEPFVIGPD